MAEQNQVQQYEQVLKDAQYRKTLSIAFFNATNAAIELVGSYVKQLGFEPPKEEIKVFIVKWRDFFLDEHMKYYATTIAPTQANYDIKESLSKLKAVKSYQDLVKIWQAYSEDERHDKKIIAEVKKLKKKYKVSSYKPTTKKNEKTQHKTKK